MLKSASLLQMSLQTHIMFKYYKDVMDVMGVMEDQVLQEYLVEKKGPKVNKDHLVLKEMMESLGLMDHLDYQDYLALKDQ